MDDVRIIRATAADVPSVTEFLQRQDVRPEPREADVAAFSSRDDASLWCALRRERVEGVAGCIKDGPVMRVAYFATLHEEEDLLTRALVQALEASSRDARAVLLAAQAQEGSQTYRCLTAQGFAAEWHERDADGNRIITTVDLVKQL